MSLRIAQISDIHAKPGGRSLAALDRALEWIAVAKPDVLIVSGDVANEPGFYPLAVEPLSRVDCPTLIVPGNKDDRAAMRRAFPGQPWPAEGPLNVSWSKGEISVVGLDVTVPGETWGDATPVLDWLRERLSGGELTFLFMHQHPFRTGFAQVDKAMCRGTDALGDVILAARSRVLLLTTGHGHRTVFTQFAGVPAMMCPSLAKANVLAFEDDAAPLTDAPAFAFHVIENSRAMSHVISLG